MSPSYLAFYCIYLSCLFVSAFTATIYRKTLKSRQLFIFVPFLWYVFLQELVAFLYRQLAHHPKTDIVYNLYRPIVISVFTWFFYHIPFNRPFRKPILWMFGLYMAFTVTTFIFLYSVFKYNPYLSTAAGIVITTGSLISLFNYFNLDNQAEEEKWRPIIWIVTGVVFFYPVVNISFAFYNHITKYTTTIFGGLLLYNTIPVIMSIFMYGCFTYAFYLCKKKI